MKVLTIDVGGTHVKILASGETEPRKAVSGPDMTPQGMVAAVKKLAKGWDFEAVSIGYPGLIVHGRIATDPVNLGPGWTGFDFGAAFGHPVKLLNDAAMQALGSYAGGRMLFLGLGTGLGTASIVDGDLEPMELAHLPFKKGKSYEEFLGLHGLKHLGKKKWRKEVHEVIESLSRALAPDYVVLGGGNARKAGLLPPHVRLGANANAFLGGFRLWDPSATMPSLDDAKPVVVEGVASAKRAPKDAPADRPRATKRRTA